jgi:hypothetical protein
MIMHLTDSVTTNVTVTMIVTDHGHDYANGIFNGNGHNNGNGSREKIINGYGNDSGKGNGDVTSRSRRGKDVSIFGNVVKFKQTTLFFYFNMKKVWHVF